MYLGAMLYKIRLCNGVWAWALRPIKHVQEAVRNCIVHLAVIYGGRFRPPKKAENPFKMGYDTELDTSPEIDPDPASYNLTIFSILTLMIKLRSIDMITRVLYLSSLVVLPREGHIDAAVQVMVRVGWRYNSRLVNDPL